MQSGSSIWARMGGRLPRRISLRVFIAILIIELIILVPSVLSFERNHLQNLRQLTDAKASGAVILAMHQQNLEENTTGQPYNLSALDGLLDGTALVGATLYSADGKEEGSVGVKPKYKLQDFVGYDDGRFAGPDQYKKAYFEFPTVVVDGEHRDTLVIRIHTDGLYTAKVNFVLRIFGLVLIIALVVCGSTMYVLHTSIIRPLYRIRDHLDAVRDDPENALDHKLDDLRDDEVGQVYQSIDNLLDRVAASHREEVDMLAGMIEESSLGAMAYDAEGRLEYVNEAFVQMWGGNDSEAFAINGPRFRNSNFPDGVTMPELLRQGAEPEVELIRADGELIPCVMNAGRLRGPNGAIVRFHATISDISKLLLLESRFRDAIESFQEGFGLFDQDDKLVVWNEPFAETAKRTGLVAKKDVTYEYILRGAANFFMGGLNEALKEAWIADRLRRHNTHAVNQFTVRVTERTWLSVTETRTAERGTAVVFANITEAKLREKELSQAISKLQAARDEALHANKAKSAFLANMSHELRTPLNAVIGYSQLLKDDSVEDGNEAIVDDLTKIEGAGQHLLHLINNILDISKVEAGHMGLQAETFAVARVVEDTVSIVSQLIEQNGNVLTVAVEQGLEPVYNDQTKLRQNLVNLLGNAAKFTQDGDVRLDVDKCQKDGVEMLRFAVSDTGIGLTEEQLKKLFQPFVQADASTTREYGGTGLGLAISKHYAELMGGWISATSEPNVGSRFEMVIPCQLNDGSAAQAEEPDDGLSVPVKSAVDEKAAGADA
ncbi:MAG: ATP-binding protein [Pikeienuella sp.]